MKIPIRSKSTGDLSNLNLPRSKSSDMINKVIPKSKSSDMISETKNYLQLAVVGPETRFQKFLNEHFYTNDEGMEILRNERPKLGVVKRNRRSDVIDLIGLVMPLIVVMILVCSEIKML